MIPPDFDTTMTAATIRSSIVVFHAIRSIGLFEEQPSFSEDGGSFIRQQIAAAVACDGSESHTQGNATA